MTTQTFITRLFGGRDIGVTYDNVAGVINILGQNLTVSTLSAALQAQWNSAVANAVGSYANGSRPAFGGDNIGQAVGNILDNQPTWRGQVQQALAVYVAEQTLGGIATDVETFNRQ